MNLHFYQTNTVSNAMSPGHIRMIGHDGVMEEEVETKAEQGEQEEQREEKPGEKINQTKIIIFGFYYHGRSRSLRLVCTPTMRRRHEMRRRERRRVVRRREGGREGVGVFSCSRRIARQQRLSRSCRRA